MQLEISRISSGWQWCCRHDIERSKDHRVMTDYSQPGTRRSMPRIDRSLFEAIQESWRLLRGFEGFCPNCSHKSLKNVNHLRSATFKIVSPAIWGLVWATLDCRSKPTYFVSSAPQELQRRLGSATTMDNRACNFKIWTKDLLFAMKSDQFLEFTGVHGQVSTRAYRTETKTGQHLRNSFQAFKLPISLPSILNQSSNYTAGVYKKKRKELKLVELISIVLCLVYLNQSKI